MAIGNHLEALAELRAAIALRTIKLQQNGQPMVMVSLLEVDGVQIEILLVIECIKLITDCNLCQKRSRQFFNFQSAADQLVSEREREELWQNLNLTVGSE